MANTARKERGSHVLSIQTGHLLDIICNLLGEFTEVSAEVRTVTPQWQIAETGETVEVDAPDNVMVQGRLAGGAWLSAQFAYQQHFGSGWRLEIYGDEGALIASLPTVGHVKTNQLMGARAGDSGLRELPVPDRFFHVPIEDRLSPALHVAEVYRSLGEAIRAGTPAYPGFEVAARLHHLLETLERSTAEGRRIVM
jgi:predicted dehydrogenase